MNYYLRAISTNFIFFVFSVIFFMTITPIAVRTMGEVFYGLWVVLIALMLLSNIGNLGIEFIVMKFSSEAHVQGDNQVQANRIMTAGYLIVAVTAIITGAILILARNLIVNNINTTIELRKEFQQAILWISAGVLPQFLTRVPHGFLLSQLHNRAARQIELFSSVSLWMGAIVIALIGKNLISMAVWCFFSNWLIFGLYLRASQRIVPFCCKVDMFTLNKMLKFSQFMFIEGLAISFFQQFDKVMVGFTLGPAIAGVYSIGTSLALRLSMVTGQATEVMIPFASLKESLDDRQKLYAVFRQLSRYVSLLLACVASLLVIWMQVFLSLWISPDYAIRYANGFRILVIAYGLLSLCRPAHQTLTGVGKVKFTSLVYSCSTILMLGGLFFLAREFGFLGAAASNLTLILLLVYNLYLYFTFEHPFQWRHVFADLRWGLLLPILFYGLSLFLPSSMLIYKLLQMIILGVLLSLAITKDDFIFVKTRLLRLKQNISKSPI